MWPSLQSFWNRRTRRGLQLTWKWARTCWSTPWISICTWPPSSPTRIMCLKSARKSSSLISWLPSRDFLINCWPSLSANKGLIFSQRRRNWLWSRLTTRGPWRKLKKRFWAYWATPKIFWMMKLPLMCYQPPSRNQSKSTKSKSYRKRLNAKLTRLDQPTLKLQLKAVICSSQ